MSDRIYLMNEGKIEQNGSPMELYLKPRTAYAAGFIGHYNMMTGEEWTKVSGCQNTAGYYAVRPESIYLQNSPWEKSQGSVFSEGIIHQIIYQGNVIRYTVMVHDVKLDIDQLYEGQCQFDRGTTVYLRIVEDEMIHYND